MTASFRTFHVNLSAMALAAFVSCEAFAQNIALLAERAGRGDARAQCELGVCYNFGQGVQKDFEKAFEWFSKAAAQGSAEGCRRLARCHEFGFGTKKSVELAASWYAKAAEMGDEKANEWLKREQTSTISKVTVRPVWEDGEMVVREIEEKANDATGGEPLLLGILYKGFYLGMDVDDVEYLLRYYLNTPGIREKNITNPFGEDEIFGHGIWLGDDDQCFCRTDLGGKVILFNIIGEMPRKFPGCGDFPLRTWATNFDIIEDGKQKRLERDTVVETFSNEMMLATIRQEIRTQTFGSKYKVTYFEQATISLENGAAKGARQFHRILLAKYFNGRGGKTGTLRIERLREEAP